MKLFAKDSDGLIQTFQNNNCSSKPIILELARGQILPLVSGASRENCPVALTAGLLLLHLLLLFFDVF